MTDPEDEQMLLRLSALARGAAIAAAPAETRAAGRARLIDTATRIAAEQEMARSRAGTLPSKSRRLAIALAALLGILAIAFGIERFMARPLAYDVSGSSNPARNYISASAELPATVRFSDGSAMSAAPGSRLRIEETRSNGARVLVERGSTTAAIEHRRYSTWSFVAGPFEVHVTGTKFTIHWDPEGERIDLTMLQGSVEIDSPIGPSRYAVTAGHRFSASVREGIVKMDDTSVRETSASTHDEEARAAEAKRLPPVADESTAKPVPAERPHAPAPSATPPASEPWPKLVRRGAFGDVVAAAEARGTASCLAECSAADLRALADAARYTGAYTLAKQALLSLRSRYGSTHQGSAAAFLLGRTAESEGDLAAAERWYATYLRESPGGEFAADALAGKMLAASRRGSKAEAAGLASEYLNSYPQGAAAAAARKLAGP
jgi:TolA-binding protein